MKHNLLFVFSGILFTNFLFTRDVADYETVMAELSINDTSVIIKKDTFQALSPDPLPYLVQLPGSWSGEKKLPLVVYLHSGSARLKTLENLEHFGLPAAYTRRNKDSFMVLSPLIIRPADTWVQKASAVLDLIVLLQSKYPVDPQRIYLTGHSLGSNGALYVTTVSKHQFAAVVVLGAGYPVNSPTPVINTPPVWMIHAANDENVPQEVAEYTSTQLEKTNKGFKYTLIPGLNHSQLLDLYASDSIYNWLLKHRL